MSLTFPLAVFALTALGGLIMAVRLFGGGSAPWALSLLHAAFGGTGIVTFYLAIAGTPVAGLLWVSLGLFVAAASGGFVLAFLHLRNINTPKAFIALHAIAAISAFAILAGSVFGIL